MIIPYCSSHMLCHLVTNLASKGTISLLTAFRLQSFDPLISPALQFYLFYPRHQWTLSLTSLTLSLAPLKRTYRYPQMKKLAGAPCRESRTVVSLHEMPHSSLHI